MGVLLFGTRRLFTLVAGRLAPRWRVLVGTLFAAALLYLWAELVVSAFTGWWG